jgi:hypothetical protein
MYGSPEYVAAAKEARRRQSGAGDNSKSCLLGKKGPCGPEFNADPMDGQPISPKRCDENAPLVAHTRIVAALLRYAATLGQVTIVTMAREGWVEATIDYLMPELHEVLDELNITIHYASAGFHRRPAYKDYVAEVTVDDVSQALKTIAVRSVLKKFYSTGRRGSRLGPTRARSWKNVISIGDSCAERHALQDVIFRHKQRDRHGDWKNCRCKVVKLLEEPSLEDLGNQLNHLSSFILDLVLRDGDIDMDMKDAVDEHLGECSSYRLCSPRPRGTRSRRTKPLNSATFVSW